MSDHDCVRDTAAGPPALTNREKWTLLGFWLITVLFFILEANIFPRLEASMIAAALLFAFAAHYIPNRENRRRAEIDAICLVVMLLLFRLMDYYVRRTFLVHDHLDCEFAYGCATHFLTTSLLCLYMVTSGWRVLQGSFGRLTPNPKVHRGWSDPWSSLWVMPLYAVFVAEFVVLFYLLRSR